MILSRTRSQEHRVKHRELKARLEAARLPVEAGDKKPDLVVSALSQIISLKTTNEMTHNK